jgi:hypothetical protein
MRPNYLVIAYYTLGNHYETLSENLKKSCEDFSIPLFLKPIENLGSWEKNTHYKANFIKECLDQFPEDLVYVDVDAVFRRYPEIFETLECDIAYRTENFRWRSDEAMSGTIFLKNNERVKSFIKEWISLNESIPAERMKPETWEQKHMQTTLRKNSDLVYFNLPPEYTFIFDHTKRMYPGLSPVIEHFQASRKQ